MALTLSSAHQAEKASRTSGRRWARCSKDPNSPLIREKDPWLLVFLSVFLFYELRTIMKTVATIIPRINNIKFEADLILESSVENRKPNLPGVHWILSFATQ